MTANKIQRTMDSFNYLYDKAYDIEEALSSLNEVCLRLKSSTIDRDNLQELKSECSRIVGLCDTVVTLYDLTNEYLEN